MVAKWRGPLVGLVEKNMILQVRQFSEIPTNPVALRFVISNCYMKLKVTKKQKGFRVSVSKKKTEG